jgi:hypothetical protein
VILRRTRVATVEGTLTHQMPAAFAGCRTNVGLGWSVSSTWGSFPGGWSHRRQRVLSGRRGGERRRRAPSARTRPGGADKAPSTFEDTSFARSRGPCTSPSSNSDRYHRKVGCGSGVTRSLRYRGRANLRKQEEPAPGPKRTNRRMRGSPRVTAFSGETSRGVVRDASEKEGGHGLRPCEETRAPARVRTSCFSCRSRQAESWPRISSHAALQKEWR